MKKILLASLLMIASVSLSAAESMRNCMLLPIVENSENKIGYAVFEDVENYIKDSGWCTYRSNSGLIDILGQYSKNLETHLSNKDVLKIIADKTKSGTMIKISLSPNQSATNVQLEVIGENGEDRYFKDETVLNSKDPATIAQTVKNWLDVYEKTIPYSGRVKGVLGDQFTIDIGKNARLFNGSEITVERSLGKRQHPLLREIVDYKTEKIATAKVFDVSEDQAQAKVIQYEGNKKLKIDDWVTVRSTETRKAVETITYGEQKEQEFGKLGSVGLFLNLGTSSINLVGTGGDRSMDSFMIGADFEGEVWATRNWWAGLDLGKRFGKYTKDSGNFTNDSNSADTTTIRAKVGYKYLPMGFFYGPQIDFYTGYAGYTYGLKTDVANKLTEFKYSGVLLGARGNLPIYQQIRLFLLFDFLLTNNFSEKVKINGKDSSSSSYRIEFGGQYAYEKNLSFQGGLQILSNKADFGGDVKEQQFRDVSAKIGAVFTF